MITMFSLNAGELFKVGTTDIAYEPSFKCSSMYHTSAYQLASIVVVCRHD
jgi:hypothetical protein